MEQLENYIKMLELQEKELYENMLVRHSVCRICIDDNNYDFPQRPFTGTQVSHISSIISWHNSSEYNAKKLIRLSPIFRFIGGI